MRTDVSPRGPSRGDASIASTVRLGFVGVRPGQRPAAVPHDVLGMTGRMTNEGYVASGSPASRNELNRTASSKGICTGIHDSRDRRELIVNASGRGYTSNFNGSKS